MKENKYYSLVEINNEANLNIFGDITSWPFLNSDVSSYNLSKELEMLGDNIDTINVHINSYGGEVAEGLAIYNALKNHKAKVKTYCDGFACSIASVIFMAGDERIMSNASLLMIHNAWTYASGNADSLRKQADNLDIITSASINAYMNEINISEDELKNLLDNESWITPSDALQMGFVTTINGKNNKLSTANQSVKEEVVNLILAKNSDKFISKEEFEKVLSSDKQKQQEIETLKTEIKNIKEEKILVSNKVNAGSVTFFNAILGGK